MTGCVRAPRPMDAPRMLHNRRCVGGRGTQGQDRFIPTALTTDRCPLSWPGLTRPLS